MAEDNKLIVLSVGGSLIVPNGGINIPFLQNLNHCIREHVKKGDVFSRIWWWKTCKNLSRCREDGNRILDS